MEHGGPNRRRQPWQLFVENGQGVCDRGTWRIVPALADPGQVAVGAAFVPVRGKLLIRVAPDAAAAGKGVGAIDLATTAPATRQKMGQPERLIGRQRDAIKGKVMQARVTSRPMLAAMRRVPDGWPDSTER